MNVLTASNGKILLIATAFLSLSCCASISNSQTSALSAPKVHYNSAGLKSPGFLGQQRLQMGGPVQGYYQPVLINGPKGSQISMAYGGTFTPLRPMPNTVGLLIGNVYRFRITNFPLPNTEGIELYPSIEIIDRLYAPEGKAVEHPIVVEIALEDVQDVLAGNLVTRVVYLEDPNYPMAMVEPPTKKQGYMNVDSSVDPVAVADTLGRPMAIIRIGGRVPVSGSNGLLSEEFLFGSPSFIDYQTSVPAPRKSITTFADPNKPAAKKAAGDNPNNAPVDNNNQENPAGNNPEKFDEIEF